MYIYKITNKINGKCYIGQTSRKVKYRVQDHFSNRKSQTKRSLINQAYHKYGKDSFIVEELCYCYTPEELDFRERYFIREHNSVAPNGYNLEYGGNSLKKLSELTKEKIKKTRKRIAVVRRDINTGEEIKYSSILETNKEGFCQHAVKLCCIGRYNIYKDNYWKFANEEFRNITIKTPKCAAIPVIRLSKDLKETKEYTSIVQASKEGFNRNCIKLCCENKQDYHKNYIWKYKES